MAFADVLEREPRDASVVVLDKTRFVVMPSIDGQLADPAVAVEAALAALGRIDAPASLTIEMPLHVVAPTVTTAEATVAKIDAERIAAPIVLDVEDKEVSITTTRLRSWLSFGPT